MATDYETTGKIFKKLDAFVKCQNPSQQMPTFGAWYYFGSSVQFKTCRSFERYLEAKHPGYIFKAHKVK